MKMTLRMRLRCSGGTRAVVDITYRDMYMHMETE